MRQKKLHRLRFLYCYRFHLCSPRAFGEGFCIVRSANHLSVALPGYRAFTCGLHRSLRAGATVAQPESPFLEDLTGLAFACAGDIGIWGMCR